MFNTLKYARRLEEAGFSREQAETSIKILVEIVEYKLTLRMGTMLAASIAILTAIQKLI